MPLANVNSPRGFQPYKTGGKIGQFRARRTVAAGRAKDLMVGDAYKDDGAGGVERATIATDVILGIVEGIDLAPLPGQVGPMSQNYIKAADAGAVIGIEDNDSLFQVQIATAALTDVGGGAALVDADGDELLVQSRQSVILDGTNKQFIIVEIIDSPADNAPGAFAQVAVKINETATL